MLSVYLSAAHRGPPAADTAADPQCATMCYMEVVVRELRQYLSVYPARVIAGEALEVTDRGHAVAFLAPLVRGESVLSRLKREGRGLLAARATPNERI